MVLSPFSCPPPILPSGLGKPWKQSQDFAETWPVPEWGTLDMHIPPFCTITGLSYYITENVINEARSHCRLKPSRTKTWQLFSLHWSLALYIVQLHVGREAAARAKRWMESWGLRHFKMSGSLLYCSTSFCPSRLLLRPRPKLYREQKIWHELPNFLFSSLGLQPICHG